MKATYPQCHPDNALAVVQNEVIAARTRQQALRPTAYRDQNRLALWAHAETIDAMRVKAKDVRRAGIQVSSLNSAGVELAGQQPPQAPALPRGEGQALLCSSGTAAAGRHAHRVYLREDRGEQAS